MLNFPITEGLQMQVESFALVLAQILPLASLPPSAHPPLDTRGDPDGAACHMRSGRVQAAPPTPEGKATCADPADAPRRLRVVDFGCGSGNLALPLAFAFPALDVCGVDMKAEAIERLRGRAAASGLSAVSARTCMIEDFQCASVSSEP